MTKEQTQDLSELQRIRYAIQETGDGRSYPYKYEPSSALERELNPRSR